MKKYPVLHARKRAGMEQKLNELRDFQHLLRCSPELNEKFHGKAEAIAYGLQPWIDALELSLRQ